MISNCIIGIVEILQGNYKISEIDDIVNDLCLIMKTEIKRNFPQTSIVILNNEIPTIEIFNKKLFNTNIYIKIKMNPHKNGFTLYLAHDWTKFKDTTKFVGDEIIRSLASKIDEIPHGFKLLSNYYGSSCWDDIIEVYLISKFHNIMNGIDENNIIHEIGNLLDIYDEVLYIYYEIINIDLIKDIEDIFKLYPVEKDNFLQSRLEYEIITYMKYDLRETINYIFNKIPDDLRLSIEKSNDEYAITPELSRDLNIISTSLFYRNGLILGVSFDCNNKEITFYISQDIDRINNANESSKIGTSIIDALKRQNADCEFKDITNMETIHIDKTNKSYDVYRFHWICSRSYKIRENTNQEKLINDFIDFMKIYDNIEQYYNYLRGTYDFYEIEKNKK